MENRSPAAERRPAHPENVAFIVVLPLVALDGTQDAPAAERIAQIIYVTARRPGILEPAAVGVGQQLGGSGRHAGIAFETLHQRREPPGRSLDVGIQQHIIIGFDLRQRPVVAFGKPIVAVELQHLDRREFAAQHLRRTVRRTVVGHDHADAPGSRRNDAREVAAQVRGTVPVEDDDFDGGHFSACASSGGATTSKVRAVHGSSAPEPGHSVR